MKVFTDTILLYFVGFLCYVQFALSAPLLLDGVIEGTPLKKNYVSKEGNQDIGIGNPSPSPITENSAPTEQEPLKPKKFSSSKKREQTETSETSGKANESEESKESKEPKKSQAGEKPEMPKSCKNEEKSEKSGDDKKSVKAGHKKHSTHFRIPQPPLDYGMFREVDFPGTIEAMIHSGILIIN